jgi:hypothetical protein
MKFFQPYQPLDTGYGLNGLLGSAIEGLRTYHLSKRLQQHLLVVRLR